MRPGLPPAQARAEGPGVGPGRRLAALACFQDRCSRQSACPSLRAAPGIRTRNLCGLSAAPLPIGLERRESGCRESDPGLHHGQVMRCHYATSACSRHPVPARVIRGTTAEPQPWRRCAPQRGFEPRQPGPGPGGLPVSRPGNEQLRKGKASVGEPCVGMERIELPLPGPKPGALPLRDIPCRSSFRWWTASDSNREPSPCKGVALAIWS